MNNHQTKARMYRSIPPPPGPGASDEEIIAFHSKYSLDELEQAGYATEPPAEEVREVMASAAYELLCQNGLHLKLPRKAYQQLSRLAAREDVAVDKLAARWIKQRLREELANHRGTRR